MIRELETEDLPAIAKLLKGLGYNTSFTALEKVTQKLADDEEYKVLIDIEDEHIVGLIALHTTSLFHRAGMIGRITSFVVDESYRGTRAVKMLLDAGEVFFKESGCTHSEASGGMINSHMRKQFLTQGFKPSDQFFTKPLKR